MSNSFFQFKQFTIQQDRCAMKVTTDACLFGGWVAEEINNEKLIMNTCLDIGTGTGLLALMLAQKNPGAFIDAIEIDAQAMRQAKENASSSPWGETVHIINADARSFQPSKKYDTIISNPPFYEKEIRSSNDNKNIAHHSDELKLYEILTIIKNNLTINGSFFLLLPYKRNKEIHLHLKGRELQISKVVFARQSVKHDYFRIMLKGRLHQNENKETEFNEISIWNEKQEYTKEFTTLLKDYYLRL